MPTRAEQVDAVRRLVRESVQAVDALVPRALHAVVPALVQARDELRGDLQDWLATAKNGDITDSTSRAEKQVPPLTRRTTRSRLLSSASSPAGDSSSDYRAHENSACDPKYHAYSKPMTNTNPAIATTATALRCAACECGEWSGDRCGAVAGPDAMVTVEWMPEDLRASHTAAGNIGTYPHNGASRSLVTQSCSEQMLADDGEWCSVVDL